MGKTSDPKIKEFSGEEFTKITFHPDFAKFNMEKLDDDTVALLSRRAYDIAGRFTSCKIKLNCDYFLKLSITSIFFFQLQPRE